MGSGSEGGSGGGLRSALSEPRRPSTKIGTCTPPGSRTNNSPFATISRCRIRARRGSRARPARRHLQYRHRADARLLPVRRHAGSRVRRRRGKRTARTGSASSGRSTPRAARVRRAFTAAARTASAARSSASRSQRRLRGVPHAAGREPAPRARRTRNRARGLHRAARRGARDPGAGCPSSTDDRVLVVGNGNSDASSRHRSRSPAAKLTVIGREHARSRLARSTSSSSAAATRMASQSHAPPSARAARSS